MQHIIEEDSTQEDGQKVSSHGWPTWNTGNEAKIMTQMIYTMTYLQALVNTEGRTEETDVSLLFWKHPLNMQKENIFSCLSSSLNNTTRFMFRTILSHIKEVKFIQNKILHIYLIPIFILFF